MSDVTLDLKGLKCPWPILKTGKVMKSLTVGETIEVLATDPGAVDDFEDYCRVTGHQLLGTEKIEKVFRFTLRKC